MNRMPGISSELPLRYAQLAQSVGLEYTRSVMQSTADYYARLMSAGLEYHRRLAEALGTVEPASVALAEAPALPAPELPPRNLTDLHFSSRAASAQSQQFVIANRQSRDVPVKFEISEFVSERTRTRCQAAVEFHPAEFVLPPGGEQVVECRVPAGAAFMADETQIALARVVGFPDMMLRLFVMADATPPAQAP